MTLLNRNKTYACIIHLTQSGNPESSLPLLLPPAASGSFPKREPQKVLNAAAAFAGRKMGLGRSNAHSAARENKREENNT
jgi:hypothetical protein